MKKPFNIHDVKPGDQFPVKVQVSLNEGSNSTMIYGKDRIPMNVNNQLIPRSFGEQLLGDKIKGYFNAHFTKDGQLSIDCRIPDQKW